MSASLPEAIASDLAKRYFDAGTLETRNSDSLDFHSVAVWNIKAALEEAYQLGRQSIQAKSAD